jgi:hypothetical protein
MSFDHYRVEVGQTRYGVADIAVLDDPLYHIPARWYGRKSRYCDGYRARPVTRTAFYRAILAKFFGRLVRSLS